MSPEERQVRADLAACYRLIARFGMSDLIYNHITAKVPEIPDMKEKFSTQGFTAEWMAQPAFGEFVQAEIAKWGKVVKDSNAKVD